MSALLLCVGYYRTRQTMAANITRNAVSSRSLIGLAVLRCLYVRFTGRLTRPRGLRLSGDRSSISPVSVLTIISKAHSDPHKPSQGRAPEHVCIRLIMPRRQGCKNYFLLRQSLEGQPSLDLYRSRLRSVVSRS